MKKEKQFLLTTHKSAYMVFERLEADWGDKPDFEDWIWKKTHLGYYVRLVDRANHIVNIYRPAQWNDQTIDHLLVDSFRC